MKKFALLLVLIFVSLKLYAPPNCEIYKNDEYCYESCKLAMKAIKFNQGAYQGQQYFDKSIALCENFAYAHMEKAVPYLKRGQFVEWKKMIDKAVEVAPDEYLGYRGWCRLQFLRDYEGAIRDIEALKKLVNYDIGYCQTGDYHLNIALALCYKELGDTETARTLFQEHLNTKNADEGVYDFYHFGVLEYEEGNYQKAIEHLNRQIEVNDYQGETYYFLAMAYKELGKMEAYRQNLNTAEEYYRSGKMRSDVYTETVDKIYLMDILEEKKTMEDKD